MSVGSNPDGGYTVLPEIDQAIDSALSPISPMRSMATVIQTGTAEYKKLVNTSRNASGWVGEVDKRTVTTSATLSSIKFPVMEMYAMPAASQRLLDDSFIDIGAWLAGAVVDDFALTGRTRICHRQRRDEAARRPWLPDFRSWRL